MTERLSVAVRIAVFLLAPAFPVEGQNLGGLFEGVGRSEFFAECAPVGLWVLVNKDNDPVGLTEDRIRTMAESRLRAARLYNSDSGLFGLRSTVRLTLAVNVFLNAFRYNATIEKTRFDPLADEMSLAPSSIGLPRLASTAAMRASSCRP